MPKLVLMYEQRQAPLWFDRAFGSMLSTAYYDPDTLYASDTVFYYEMYGPFQELIPQQLAAGHRIIFDAKNEQHLSPDKQWVVSAFTQSPGQGMFVITGSVPHVMTGVNIAATPYWYWIMEYDNFLGYGYKSRPHSPRHEYRFFMQMSQAREERSTLYNILKPVLQHSLHSYKGQGRHLPNDVDPAEVSSWQRYMNWDWVNSCDITLVVESHLADHSFTGISIADKNNSFRFLTEKTYKPIAYGHAFLMAGRQLTLAHVREQGFETFPELWDESYDLLPNYQDRARHIRDIVQAFDSQSLHMPVVQEKIAHNQNRFFDSALVQRLLSKTVVQPVVTFVEAN